MTVTEIIKTLNEFVPFSDNDPVNDNETFFSDLMNDWEKMPGRENVIPAIFNLMEKFPHADFGSPGPIVHALESNGVKFYEVNLHKSLMKKPTPLTVWMYNRIINAENDDRIIKGHIERLKLFGRHPFADEETKKVIKQFLDYQEKRS